METPKQHLLHYHVPPYRHGKMQLETKKDPASLCCIANTDLQLSLKQPHRCQVLPPCNNLQVANGLSNLYLLN